MGALLLIYASERSERSIARSAGSGSGERERGAGAGSGSGERERGGRARAERKPMRRKLLARQDAGATTPFRFGETE